MSYELLLTPEAREDLLRLPSAVLDVAFRHLDALGDSPVLLSERSVFPYIQKSQSFRFDVDHAAFRWELTVMFQYDQDEQHLHVLAVGQVWRDREQAEREDGPAR